MPPECLCLLAGSLGMRPELQAGSSSLHPPSGKQGKDGEPGVLPNHSGLTGTLESGVLPGSARSLQGVQKTAVASLGQGKWWV